MVKFTFGQKLWDSKNCREIEIVGFNGVSYWCKVLSSNLDWSNTREFYLSWFTEAELDGFRVIN